MQTTEKPQVSERLFALVLTYTDACEALKERTMQDRYWWIVRRLQRRKRRTYRAVIRSLRILDGVRPFSAATPQWNDLSNRWQK
jgi:hypothetical protein